MTTKKVGRELRSLNNLIRRYFEFSSHKNEVDTVTGNNGWIISYLADNSQKDIFQRDIEDYFTITRSTASKVLTLMEQKGLIERHSVAQDARLKKIVLTDKAWEICGLMREDSRKMEELLLKDFSEDDVKTLLFFLDKMKNNISSMQ
ncbi:MarR family winged helix-turn-helix transcriptional regulator [Scatolibacter rhodanostii]|uniref:MarR family winged helix-turn-helix transcriptional regulator n=1 Tax=Scatolibacter rhodanostii TaxID=2014781 RepID=UPI000C089A56|nr:MarR family transcriptional regulator [Scatolibacter rhodanostii]